MSSPVSGARRCARATPQASSKGVANLITVPFVDYARGDGISIGPGQDNAWSPVLIDGDGTIQELPDVTRVTLQEGLLNLHDAEGAVIGRLDAGELRPMGQTPLWS